MTGRSGGGREADGEWEVRPGGMLVQRRDGEAAIRVRVSHGAALRDVAAPAQATFGTHPLFCLDRPLPAWSLSLTRIGGVQSRLGSDLDRSTSQSKFSSSLDGISLPSVPLSRRLMRMTSRLRHSR
jgi:hypothetical protein